MIKIILLIIALASSVFATDSIYTWGYADIFAKVLNGVVIISQDDYIFKAAVGVGGFILITKTVLSGASSSDATLVMGKFLFMATIIIGMFSENTKNYIVEDEITGQAIPVNNVPIGIGETFSLFSGFEKSLAGAFETAFATPSSVKYDKVGLGFNMGAPLTLTQAQVADGYIVRTFNEYTENCLMSAVAEGVLAGDVISNSKNLKQDLKVTGYLTPYYSAGNAYGTTMACEDVWDALVVDLGNKVDGMIEISAKKMMIDKNNMINGMAATTNMMFGMSQSASDYVLQQTMINMTNKGLAAAALATGGDASALAYSKSLAEQNQKQSWVTGGILNQQNLPLMKAALTILVLGLFMLFAILSLVFFDISYIKTAFSLLFSVLLWTPLAILLNGMVSIIMESIMPGISLGGTTMSNIKDINGELSSFLAIVVSLYGVLPVLAYSIVSKSAHGFVSVFSGMGGASASAASAAAGQTASGNLSLGQANVGGFKATDKYGSHEYMGGNNSWKDSWIGNDGSMRSTTRTNSGAGVTETDGAGYGKIKLDNSTGNVTSVNDAAVSASVNDDFSSSYKRGLTTTQNSQTSFATAFGDTVGKSLTSGGMVIDTNTFTDNKSLSATDQETLTKTTQSAITDSFRKAFNDDKKFTFTTTDSAKTGIGGTVDWSIPELAKIFTGGIGVKAGVNGGLDFVGQTADGKSYSMTLSGDEAETFSDTFAKTVSKSIADNDSVAKAWAHQTQSTKGYGDSKLLNKAETHSTNASKSDALSKAFDISENNRTSFGQDLLPAAINKFVDNDTTLSRLRASGLEGATDAADEALKRMRNPRYKEQTDKAFEQASGLVDVSPKKALQADVMTKGADGLDMNTKVGDEVQTQLNSGTKVATKAQNAVNTVNLQNVPDSIADIKAEDKKIDTMYKNESKKLEQEQNKDMDKFEAKNDPHLKKEIEDKTKGLENQFNDKKDEVGAGSAIKLNPTVQTITNKIQDAVDGIDAVQEVMPVYSANGNTYNGKGEKQGEWSNKSVDVKRQVDMNDKANEKAYEKAIQTGLVEKGMFSDEIDPAKMKKTDTETLKRVYQESKDMTSGMDDKSDGILKKELESRGVKFSKSGENVWDSSVSTDKDVIKMTMPKPPKPTGGMGGDTIDGGSGHDTFQPPVAQQIEQRTEQPEQPSDKLSPQVQNEQTVSTRFEQPEQVQTNKQVQPRESEQMMSKDFSDKYVDNSNQSSSRLNDRFTNDLYEGKISNNDLQSIASNQNFSQDDRNMARNFLQANEQMQQPQVQSPVIATQPLQINEPQFENRNITEQVPTQAREQRTEQPQQPSEVQRPQVQNEQTVSTRFEQPEQVQLRNATETVNQQAKQIKTISQKVKELKESQEE